MHSPIRIGLTGGIGSGKSTVSAMLAGHGAAVIDADAIARQVTAPNGSAMKQIRATFGADFVTAEGALDRDKMRALAFADPSSRQRLEAIVHPLVGLETQRLAAVAESPCLVFDIPLLAESTHWRQRVSRVLVVDCTVATQIARVMARNALPREAVEKIIAAQASRQQRLACADIVLWNDTGPLDALRHEVAQLAAGFGL